MKYIHLIVSAGMLLLAACGSTKQINNRSDNQSDTIATADTTSQGLTARMRIKPVINGDDAVLLTFTVFNSTPKAQTFCKWHTPFEPPMSRYLDVRDDKGNELQYLGAMAKRVMPPPAGSYLKVKAGDSLSVTVDLRKSYLLNQPGKYNVQYNAEGISGLSVKDVLSFEYRK
jgi:hypothetical protein